MVHRYGQVDTSLINGFAKTGEKRVILLDIEKVLTMTEGVRATEAAEATVNHSRTVGGLTRATRHVGPRRKRRRRDAWRRTL